MINLTLTKTIIGLVASVGAGQVVGNIVRVTTPDDLGRITRITTKIGGVVLGGLVGTQAEKYTHNAIDELVDLWTDLPNKTKDVIKGEVIADDNND